MKRTTLEAMVEQLDEAAARVRIKGEVEGSAPGGSGNDHMRRLPHVRPRGGPGRSARGEPHREPPAGTGRGGPRRQEHADGDPAACPPRPRSWPTPPSPTSRSTSPERQILQLLSPDGKYNLLHDRQWHTYWDDPKLTVLKRLDDGKVVAQCNLTAGPAAGKGRHQDLTQFRDDIRRSLKQRFVQFLGAGEVEGDPAGGFRYKVGVQGREGELGVLWYYYLIASPEGDQVLATFTLAEEDAEPSATRTSR